MVSVRTVEVPMFTTDETYLLLTDPVARVGYWKDAPDRPHFATEFWGPGGIETVHREAGGWPHLVQLIAETVVDLTNNIGAREVDDGLMQRALDKAVVRGKNVLYELMQRESTLAGEWEYLLAFRKRDTQAPPDDEAICRSLRRRRLMQEDGDEWRLRVPLMQRWLRSQA